MSDTSFKRFYAILSKTPFFLLFKTVVSRSASDFSVKNPDLLKYFP